MLALGPEVILPDGYPLTAELLARAGFTLHPVPIGEFEHALNAVSLCF